MKSENNLEELDMSYSEWRSVKLSDISFITMGQSPKSEFYNSHGDGVPFMQGRTTFGYKYHGIDTWCTKPTRMADKNSILMSVRAPVGDVNIATQDLCIGRGLAALNMKNGNNEFLYYLLLHEKQNLISRETGTVFGSINKAGLENLEITIPDDNEQRAIADILSSLDEKIEVNNQMNETLEEMAQALFKRWFVDFEFPNEEGQPYKSSGGEMVESELGMIPRGWSVKGLGELINISSGKRPSKKSSEKDKEYRYPLIGASSIMGYVLEPLCEDKILVIGRVGTHGVVQRFCGPVWPSDNTLVIRTVYYEFINQILQRIDYSAINRGSTQPLITQTDIKNTKIIVPDKNLLKVYEEKCESLFNMIEHNEIEKVYLGSLRDTLLPKLMSGEIRVSDLKS